MPRVHSAAVARSLKMAVFFLSLLVYYGAAHWLMCLITSMSEYVTVNIPQGTLRGKRVTSAINGVTYYSFQGIPYAKPPVGPLRFKPPEDPEPWTGTRDATVEGPVAPQINMFTQKAVGNEDCLFLNVYTQHVNTSSPKAVMVWIHGGAYFLGSGNMDVFGPDYLISEDIVLVTINYRLGALGFLYLEGTGISGNNGLRDQVMALKWVKNNIAHFGGDPNNVTIFGQSAGGSSVHFLMLSPLASGLFHRAIAQSGTAMMGNCYIPRDVSSQRAVLLAKLLGCASEDPQEVENFLRTVPSEEFAMHQMEAMTIEDYNRPIEMPFFPSEEVGPEVFLPGNPRKLLQEGRFTKVPFIAGVTSAEGKVLLKGAFQRVKPSDLDKQFEDVLPPSLSQNYDVNKRKEIARIIKKFYFKDRALGDDTVAEYVDLLSDLMFVYPMHQMVQMQNRWSQYSTYIYLFDHKSPTSVDLYPNHNGAPHGADVPYFFPSPSRHIISPGSPESQVSTKLVKLWTHFAKTGNPSNDETNVTWTPATKGNLRYLKINISFNMELDMFKKRMEFLDDIYVKFSNWKRTD